MNQQLKNWSKTMDNILIGAVIGFIGAFIFGYLYMAIANKYDDYIENNEDRHDDK